MTLDELLEGEVAAERWLRERGLLHECDCGYTVYDNWEVNEAVQEEFGDDRADEIFDWACNLGNEFGWMDMESSMPEHGIYHCQYCAKSELSLLFDIEAIARSGGEKAKKRAATSGESIALRSFKIFVDESYIPDFPRAGQDYAYAAVIVPENQVEKIGTGLEEIVRRIFPKEQSKELKYSELWRDPVSRERLGTLIVQQLLLDIPGLAVLGLYVTKDGFFNERIRSLRAMRESEKAGPTPEEIAEITSSARIDEAVRTGAQNLAVTVACGCASYVVGQGGRGEILFDPIEAKKDAILSRELESVLPLMPTHMPVIRHGDALVTLWPSPEMERIGDRLSICSSPPESKNCPGLQLADFCAGDIRRFFSENPTLLTAGITEDIIVNKRMIFPQVFQAKQMPHAVMEAFRSRRGDSFLPGYVAVLARGLISYYTTNGHTRNLPIPTGNVFDIVD